MDGVKYQIRKFGSFGWCLYVAEFGVLKEPICRAMSFSDLVVCLKWILRNSWQAKG